MKILLPLLPCLFSLLTTMQVIANDAIDTSAVTKLLALKQSSTALTIPALEQQLLADDAGGLTMLRGRFQDAGNLQKFYASLNEHDWRAVQQCALLLRELEPEFNRLKAQLSKLTDVPLADVKAFGVIASGNTAATASPQNIVLGLEMICTPTKEATQTKRELHNYLAHELVHVIQYRLTRRTDLRFNLLEISLLEGSADYIADMLLDEQYVLDDARKTYGDKAHSELLSSFARTMLSYDYTPWLYTPLEDKPMDMGYWVGFTLAEAFINNGGTLVELLTLDDAQAIYAKAGI